MLLFSPNRFSSPLLSKNLKIHSEEIHSLYRLPKIVRVINFIKLKWGEHVARMEEGRSAFKVLAGKLTGKRLIRRPRPRLENNVRMYHK